MREARPHSDPRVECVRQELLALFLAMPDRSVSEPPDAGLQAALDALDGLLEQFESAQYALRRIATTGAEVQDPAAWMRAIARQTLDASSPASGLPYPARHGSSLYDKDYEVNDKAQNQDTKQ